MEGSRGPVTSPGCGSARSSAGPGPSAAWRWSGVTSCAPPPTGDSAPPPSSPRPPETTQHSGLKTAGWVGGWRWGGGGGRSSGKVGGNGVGRINFGKYLSFSTT